MRRRTRGEGTSALSAGSNALLRLGATPLLAAADLLSALGVEPPEARAADVSADAARALATVREGPIGADELARETGLEAGRLAAALSELELAALVAVDEGVYRAHG